MTRTPLALALAYRNGGHDSPPRSMLLEADDPCLEIRMVHLWAASWLSSRPVVEVITYNSAGRVTGAEAFYADDPDGAAWLAAVGL